MIALELDRVSRDFVTPDGHGYRALDDISLCHLRRLVRGDCRAERLRQVDAAQHRRRAAGAVERQRARRRRAADRSQSARDLHVSAGRAAAVENRSRQRRAWIDARRGGGLATPTLGPPAGWRASVLSEFAAHYPSQLSGGMRKRVAMAQNWIIDRGIVLMDEPFSALDVHTRQRMETELLALWEGSARARPVERPSSS